SRPAKKSVQRALSKMQAQRHGSLTRLVVSLRDKLWRRRMALRSERMPFFRRRHRHLCVLPSMLGFSFSGRSKVSVRSRSSAALKSGVGLAVLALVSASAWAFDASELAPATPEKPWVIPSPAEAVKRYGQSDPTWALRRGAEQSPSVVPIESKHLYKLAE